MQTEKEKQWQSEAFSWFLLLEPNWLGMIRVGFNMHLFLVRVVRVGLDRTGSHSLGLVWMSALVFEWSRSDWVRLVPIGLLLDVVGLECFGLTAVGAGRFLTPRTVLNWLAGFGSD